MNHVSPFSIAYTPPSFSLSVNELITNAHSKKEFDKQPHKYNDNAQVLLF
jgi:hypothetical protein